MHFGQPSAGAPGAAIAAAHAALDTDPLGYWESAALQERIAQHYRQRYGVDLPPERILLTAGASAALVATFAALFRPGDRVAVVRPGYPAYRNTLSAMGLIPIEMRCDRDRDFKPSMAMLERLDPPPLGFVVASPANPTGTMLDRRELAALTAGCRQRGIHLISDEIYHGIDYGLRAITALESDPDAIVINSFSKLYRMPGWRLGWIVVPQEWVSVISAFLINMFLTPSTLAQHAALAALDEPEDLQRWVQIYARNRTHLLAGLKAMGITDVASPDGAIYLYANVGHLTQDSLRFCISALEATGVALAPGIDFDPEFGHGFVRFSFAVTPEEIELAVQRLTDWLPSYVEPRRPSVISVPLCK